MSFLLAAIAALVPLAMAPKLFLYFETAPKTAIILIGAACLLLNLRKFEAGLEKLARSLFGQIFMVAAAAQCISLSIVASSSQDKTLSFLGTAWRRLGSIECIAIVILSLLAAAWYAENFASILVLLRAISFSGIVASAYGILQYLGWDPFADASRYSVAYGDLEIVRPPSTVGHADYFADYLVVLIFMSVALIAWESSRFAKGFALFSAVLAFIALLLTGTRAGLAGLLAGGVFLLFRIRPAITKKRVVIAVALAASCGLLYASPLGERLDDRFVQWYDDAKGGTRPLLWRDCLQMARAHIWLGAGPELFATEFPKFESIELARDFPNYYHESPHNILLDAMLSQGLPGLIILLLQAGVAIFASFRWKTRSAPAAALAAGCIGLFVSQQFTGFVPATALFFQLMIAILVAGSLPDAILNTGPSLAVKTLRFVSLPAAALLALAGVQIAHVDARWAAIQRAIRAGSIEEAMAGYEQVEKLYPPESGANLWYSRAITQATIAADPALRKRVWSQALEAATRATSVSEDRHNAYYNLAVFYSAQGDLPHAEQALRSAVECAPHWFKPHWLLGEVLLLSGRLDLAAKEAQQAIDLNAKSGWELDDTLRRIRLKQQASVN